MFGLRDMDLRSNLLPRMRQNPAPVIGKLLKLGGELTDVFETLFVFSHVIGG